ncbi:unnamed protein product [Oikopleura dioica]|uniref:SprT-like domain-containing protein n=1 Tax=Oikopleura dioica TaxID=34765 RepID=E4YRK9_OIKDI|nr:unnamed protein product [Oikopleura dioica]
MWKWEAKTEKKALQAPWVPRWVNKEILMSTQFLQPVVLVSAKTDLNCVSESTPCGYNQCILYDVENWSTKRLKENLSELIEEIYETLNRTIFAFKLPVNVKHRGDNVFTSKDGLMTIVWNKHLRSTAGRCRSGVDIATAKKKSSVELAPHILDTAPRIRDTLLHELIHAANWIIDEDPLAGHGPKFRAWGFKSLKTHPEIPPVKTTHSYQINYKYWWECENMAKGTCSVKIGRKTNSLKLDRVRCAKCAGNFVYVRFKYHQKEKKLKV